MEIIAPAKKTTILKEKRMNTETYFNAAYNETYHELLKFVIIKISHADQVEDIVQSTYQRFFRRIVKKGYEDIRNPQAFLFDFAKKELANHYSFMKSKQEQEAGFDEMEQAVNMEGVDFTEILIDKQAVECIWEIIKNGPLRSYKAFVMYYKYDMSIPDIAKHLNISEENVKVRLFRARNHVRKAVKGE